MMNPLTDFGNTVSWKCERSANWKCESSSECNTGEICVAGSCVATLVASDGTVFERASTNAECCSKGRRNNIPNSEDNSYPGFRYPLLTFTEGTFRCWGGFALTYRQWIRKFLKDYEKGLYIGVCYEGWRYFKAG